MRILEAGCGYGGNLKMLAEFGTVDAFEYDAEARRHAAALHGRPIAFGHLPDQPGFETRRFDLVAMLDVLEHIDADIASLAALRGVLAKDGLVLLTVPALPWLWSKHDEIHHHKRRYTRTSLDRTLRAAGLRPVKIGYFNSILFPLAVCQRLGAKLLGQEASVDGLPPAPLNTLFARLFGLERWLVGRVPMPIGLSLFAIAELPRD